MIHPWAKGYRFAAMHEWRLVGGLLKHDQVLVAQTTKKSSLVVISRIIILLLIMGTKLTSEFQNFWLSLNGLLLNKVAGEIIL